MAISTIKATMQMRRGAEQHFDPDQMTAGEWAVSTDSKKVWMCFAPGIVRRMATYEAFEEDMLIIQQILATCQDIQEAVEAFEQLAEQHKDDAKKYADASAGSAKESKDFSLLSKSYAVGTGGEMRPDDDTDSSKGYYELAKRLAQGYNGIIPMGTITFAELADAENQVPKYMFNISDAFTSDSRFGDGGGKYYGAGSNVVFTADEKWDVLTASAVTGIKGAAETDYRQGNVSLSPEDIGAFPDVATIGADGDDLDVKKTSGIWLYTLNRKPAVYPGADGRGWLLVMEGTSGLVKQIWYQYGANSISADTYVRTCKSDGTWSPWAKYAMKDEVLAVPKLIPNTADLDTYRDAGFYYAVGGNSILHKPDGVGGFSLLVLRTGNTARKQVVYPNVGDAYAFFRVDADGSGYEAHWHGTGSQGVTASDVVYDNSASGMAAENVQGAIDALSIELDEHIEDAVRHIDKEERTAWNGKLDSTGDASNVAVNFSQASTRANLASKEKLSVSLGKIMKWFADLANGAASTLLGSNLTASRALVSNGSGKVAVSSVTATELGYLDGVTSGIQQQLNGLKISKSSSLTWYGVTIGIYRYGWMGSIATISGNLTAGLTAYTKYTLGTIASGFRPLNQLTKIILIQGDVQAMLNITREGVVELTPYAALARGYVPLIAEMYEIS